MNITVEMFGLSPFTEANSVDLEVDDGETLAQIIQTLAQKMPSLKGRVIQPEGRLVETYGLYVNGQFVGDDHNVQIKQGDRIVLILLATGG